MSPAPPDPAFLPDEGAALDRRVFLGGAAGFAAVVIAGSSGAPLVERGAGHPPMTGPAMPPSGDGFAIEQLNALYFHALDGLRGPASDRVWAACFTPKGQFRLVDAEGTSILEANGLDELVKLYPKFPDVATTRHWVNNVLIERAGRGVRMSCYIIAMDIGHLPGKIARTGVYTDELTRTVAGWRFRTRTLTLDRNSPAPS
jgi:hypothetical protein